MDIGRIILTMGILLVVIGGIVMLLQNTTGMPKLPGDIYIKRDNFTFYFPWVTSIIISIILTIILNFFIRK